MAKKSFLDTLRKTPLSPEEVYPTPAMMETEWGPFLKRQIEAAKQMEEQRRRRAKTPLEQLLEKQLLERRMMEERRRKMGITEY